MENLIGIIVFVLPGFMLYFWIQMMGINPVVKHTVAEFGALAALCWFPVAAASLGIMETYRKIEWTLGDLKDTSGSIAFIAQFLGISFVVSFVLSIIYVRYIFGIQQLLVNLVRRSIEKTPLSRSPSVWEEVFFNNRITILGISKFGSDKPDIVGSAENVARPFEPKRGFKLIYMDYVKLIIEKYDVPIVEIFTDIDAGVNVFIYDNEAYEKADIEERKDPQYIEIFPPRSTS